ncbi:MAG: MFS transporter [Hamadaea sp.]|uniref:MFS transporter n=1 Tax=Hamadaea sp. TaxID=2024425 RepID=UPI0018153863|nr:MFS transporter [Hamadaea sp.]NUR72148.1 MFS transporter [Hamadaea sp.]NUT21325.1 MFS transporter [Hamadaea sp.]
MTTLAPPETVEAPVVPAHRVPQFRRYATGQAVSVLGDQVWYVALSWAAVQIASPGVAGVLLSISALPRLALMLFGGVLVDRREPRRLMVHSDLVRGLICVAAAAVAVWQPSVLLLIVVALAFGAADAVFLPAAGALQPRLLTPAQYAGGNALISTVNRLALTLGAPLGGVLVATGGLPTALVVNAATFAVSVLALRSLKPAPVSASTSDASKSGLRDGLRYIAGHRVLRATILVGLLGNLGFVGPMNVGLALASQSAGWGATGIGLLLSGFGIGAIVAGLAMMRFRPHTGIGPIAAVCFALQGVAVVVPAVTHSLPLAVVATAIAGLTSGPAGILLGSLTQSATSDAYRGRVSSVNALANLGLTPLVMAAAGWATGLFGLVPAMAASGALELVAAVGCVALPALRTARLPR